MRFNMLLTIIALISIACADTASPVDDPQDSEVPSEEDIKEEIEAAGDPGVDAAQVTAIELIEGLHDKQDVEALRQKLLEEKAAQISTELKAQEEAERKAKTEAERKAQEEIDAKSEK